MACPQVSLRAATCCCTALTAYRHQMRAGSPAAAGRGSGSSQRVIKCSSSYTCASSCSKHCCDAEKETLGVPAGRSRGRYALWFSLAVKDDTSDSSSW